MLTAVALVALGHEIALRLWRGASVEPMERAASALLLGLALWLGSTWSLALVHLLTREVLIGRSIAAGVIAFVLMQERGGCRFRPRLDALVVIALLPIAAWVAFALWRGWVVPPLSHDALAYHLPKAVLYVRAHGFELLRMLHPHAWKLPANYEMLLADAIATTGLDRATEWISTLLYVAIVIVSVALAQRWWVRHRLADTAMALLVGGMPLLLLHSSAHKNDLLVTFALLAALLWGGRFAATGERPALVLLIVALALAIGTKPQAGALAIAFVPVVLWRLRAQLRIALLLQLAAASLLALVLLGGAVYVTNILYPEPQRTVGTQIVHYGDWRNLWEGPYVLIAGPWSPTAGKLMVPWAENPWFWRRYEIYFSHLGIPFSLCAVAMFVAMGKLRRKPNETERYAATFGALVTFVAMLPVGGVPHGLYTISLPRYALFLAPVVFAWTAAPLLRALRETWALAGVAVAAVVFVAYAIDFGRNDDFAPLHYVRWAAKYPGTRVVHFDPHRAGEVADRMAGSEEKIAMYAGYAAWIHPVFGPELTRPVQLVPWNATRIVPDRDARWIVIDRGYESAWNHPEFKDLSQAGRFLAQGQPPAKELELVRAAVTDPRLEVVYWEKRTNQIVLRARPTQ